VIEALRKVAVHLRDRLFQRGFLGRREMELASQRLLAGGALRSPRVEKGGDLRCSHATIDALPRGRRSGVAMGRF
jgi:hypothetical protein